MRARFMSSFFFSVAICMPCVLLLLRACQMCICLDSCTQCVYYIEKCRLILWTINKNVTHKNQLDRSNGNQIVRLMSFGAFFPLFFLVALLCSCSMIVFQSYPSDFVKCSLSKSCLNPRCIHACRWNFTQHWSMAVWFFELNIHALTFAIRTRKCLFFSRWTGIRALSLRIPYEC